MDSRHQSFGCVFELSIHDLARWGISTKHTSLIQQSLSRVLMSHFSLGATEPLGPDRGLLRNWSDEVAGESKMGKAIPCFEVDQICSLTTHDQQLLDIATKRLCVNPHKHFRE